jgi:hypothetical protein
MSLDVYLENDPCPHCGIAPQGFDANITHNLIKMAKEAGIYFCLWRPEELDMETASEIVPHLKHGLSIMKDQPSKFRKYDSPNGWGTYDDFVPWIEKYISACEKMPDAKVIVSR